MSDKKETIYVDVDDEITGIIDKVTSSKSKVVALVLPKRATVMQSIVNMKLLKRSCDDAGKNIVLITSEASVLPLAGAIGVYTAKTLQSRPFIPEGNEPDESGTDETYDDNTEIDSSKSVGELSGDDDAIEVDNESDDGKETEDANKKPSKESKSKKNKKLKIPNFDSFRKKLFLGIGIFIILVIGWYIAFFVMPKATITIKTDTETSAVDITFTADPAVKTLDMENKVVPAELKESKVTKTEKTATTGEKNNGDKASGKVTMKLTTDCVTPLTDVPAGNTISSNGLNFITQEKAKFTPPPVPDGSGNCVFSSNEVDVIAEKGGGSYNLSGRAYTVSGFSSVIANGSNMSGGTDKIVKIVSQQDVDTAKNKALENNVDEVKGQLSEDLRTDGYMPIPESFNNSEPTISSSPNVGDEANEVSVTVITTYTMLGAKQSDVEKLLEEDAKKNIDTNKQSISDYGFESAVYQVSEITPDGKAKLNMKTEVTAGTQLNEEDIKQQSAGKRRGEIQENISSIPGVKDVEVAYKPFWVTKTPNSPKKITVIIENAGE
ncbi:hypothetical protein KDA00_02910 [Candidatus Saccharibacteria bacterium]|nr:hypothetical protein [Candidatus Saccharibacteria bacterium]